MGNYIEEMYIYTYTKLNGETKEYSGIHEVVRGALNQNRANNKYEAHIKKILAYPIKNRWNKELSHMSLQGYCTYLKNQKRNLRTDEIDDAYYPFVLEFESRKRNEQIDVALEAAQYIQYLLDKLNVNEKDIVVRITPKKSIYVEVNPKIFGLIPGKYVYKIYTEMYRRIKRSVSLNFVDESIVNSSYRLIKTPGSYYAGGYVNHITIDELMELMTKQKTRRFLTKHQRDIRKLELPGIKSEEMSRLYEDSKKYINKVIKESKKRGKVISFPGDKICNRACVKTLLDMPIIEKGNRNNFLVTIALGLKEAGYSKEEINKELRRKATEWKHDESLRAVENKYKSIVNNKTNFSCDKVKMLFEEEGLKISCKTCDKEFKEGIALSRNIIESIFRNNGAPRHYKAYLELEKQNLLGKFFDLEETKIDKRTLKELVKKANGTLEEKDGKYRVFLNRGKAIYRLPLEYIDNNFDTLKQKIGKVLMLIVQSYSENEYGVFISLNKIKIAELLSFKSERSAYNFIKELENLGFLTKNKKGYTIYYKNRKVISLEEEKEIRERKTEVEIIEYKKVANGIQLKFNFEKLEVSTNIQEINGEIYIFARSEGEKYRRGSPPN